MPELLSPSLSLLCSRPGTSDALLLPVVLAVASLIAVAAAAGAIVRTC